MNAVRSFNEGDITGFEEREKMEKNDRQLSSDFMGLNGYQLQTNPLGKLFKDLIERK